jgi:hypothetical protein
MSTDNKKITRSVSREFSKVLDNIKQMRLTIGKDKRIQDIKPDWRITLAMSRHPKFNEICEDIINSDLR